MPNSTISSRRPSRQWLLPILSAVAALVVGVFGNLLANDLEKLFGPKYRWLVWGVFSIAAIVTIVTTIIATRRNDALLPGAGGVHMEGDLSVAGDVVGRDKSVDKSIKVGDVSHTSGVAIGEKATVTIIQQAALQTFQPLHQLPAPPLDFTGREAELNELLAKMESGGVTISGLQAWAASAKPRWR